MAFLPIALGVSAGLDALSGAKSSNDAKKQAEQALAFQMSKYRDTEPLRAMALERLQMPLPERPNLTAGFADTGNPYYQAPAAIGFGEKYSNQPVSAEGATQKYRDAVQARPDNPLGIPFPNEGLPLTSGQKAANVAAQGGPRRKGESMSRYINRLREGL